MPVASAAILGWLAYRLRDYRGVDDVQITFVFARSFAEGEGLTWNGEPVLGTSSPFLAVLLGLLGRISGAGVDDLGIALGWLALWASAVGQPHLLRAEPAAGSARALLDR